MSNQEDCLSYTVYSIEDHADPDPLLLLLQAPCLKRLDPVGLFIRFSDRDKFLFVSPNISALEEKYSLCSRAIVLSHYISL